jgi:hypothetical protein
MTVGQSLPLQGELATVIFQILLSEAGDQTEHFPFGMRLLQRQAVFMQ